MGGAEHSYSQAMIHNLDLPYRDSSSSSTFGPTAKYSMQSIHNAETVSQSQAATPLKVKQMYAQQYMQYIGEGLKSDEDVANFMEKGTFGLRVLTDFELCVHYAVLIHNGLGQSGINALLPAPQCDHVRSLKKFSRCKWSKVFKDLGQVNPSEGVKPERVSIEAKESYGENTFFFYDIQTPERYSQWFEKNAYHGLAPKLHVRFT